MESVDVLNRRLIDTYGIDLYGKPKWRLVWAPAETEKRLGTFTVETESGIYLRTETTVKEVPKYWNLPKCWVLETIFSCGDNPELNAVANFTYEPIWPFHDKDNQPVEPEWWAIEMVIHAYHTGQVKMPKNTTIIDNEYQEKKKKEVDEFHEIIKNDSPYLAGKLRDKEAVTVPSNYEAKK